MTVTNNQLWSQSVKREGEDHGEIDLHMSGWSTNVTLVFRRITLQDTTHALKASGTMWSSSTGFDVGRGSSY